MQNIDFSRLEIQCSSMDNNINYYKISLQNLEEIKKSNKKPRLLLHSCCGPCATLPLTFLCPFFDVTIFFNNSNIYPSEEYYRRLNELKKLLEYYKRDYGFEIGLIETKYDNDTYNIDLEPYKDMPEGTTRCFICYEKRLNEGFKFANENGFEYFTTVMSVSRQKNSQVLNQIGLRLQEKYPNTKYFVSDFKKNHGLEIGTELRKKYNLYQQLYCGCKYTYADGMRRLEERKNAKKAR